MVELMPGRSHTVCSDALLMLHQMEAFKTEKKMEKFTTFNLQSSIVKLIFHRIFGTIPTEKQEKEPEIKRFRHLLSVAGEFETVTHGIGVALKHKKVL